MTLPARFLRRQHGSSSLLFLLLSLLGAFDALYLTLNHASPEGVSCSLTSGCKTVLTSEYSEVFGIPLSVFGIAYYATVFLLVSFYLYSERVDTLRLAAYFTTIGFLVSGWLVAIQLFILHSVCQYCMFSAIISTLLFPLGVVTVKNISANEVKEE